MKAFLLQSSYMEPTSRNLYEAAATIAECSMQRLCLCQDSPSCIVPVKRIGDRQRDDAEKRLYYAMKKWIARVRGNTRCRFLLLGAVDQPRREFHTLPTDYERSLVLQRLSELDRLEEEYPEFFRLGWVESHKKDMVVASAGERRYGLCVRNPLSGARVALFIGSNKRLAEAVFANVERTIGGSTFTTKSLVRLLTGYFLCFMSYSKEDRDFAERLHGDLGGEGVRCWIDSKDLKPGDRLGVTIEESIRGSEKLLLVVSEHSVRSEWVEKEVETAIEQERDEKRTMLFPIRLDDTVMGIKAGWPADIRRTRYIGDFTNWKDQRAYGRAFERLLRDLKAGIRPAETT